MIKRIFSLIYNLVPTLLSLVLLLFVIVQASSGIFDTDIWLHLKTGKLILENLRVPTTEPYSFTTQSTHWINHEWLFQVIVFSAYKFFSVNGIVFLQTLFITLAFFVLFMIGFRNNKFLLLSFLLSILAVFACRTRFNLRPDILSLIFFGVFLFQLKYLKEKKYIYSLALFQALWVNCHGYFFLGPLLVFIYICAEFIRRSFKQLPEGWRETGKLDDLVFKRLLNTFLIVVLVSLINPQFLKGAMYPFYILRDMFNGEANFAFKHIEELARVLPWKSSTFTGGTQLNILVLIATFSLILNFRKLDLADLLLFVFFVPFGFIVLRNVAFLAFLAYTLIITRLEIVDEAAKKRIKVDVASAKLSQVLKFAVIVVGILFLFQESYISLFRSYYDFQKYEMKSLLTDTLEYRYPRRCVAFINKHKLPHNLLNDFNSGAYLIFHAWPRYKVFVDGRTELYSKKFFDTYFKIMNGDKKEFDATVKKFNINTILLNNATANIPSKALKMIYEHPDWQLVFFDDQGVVFLKKTPQNEQLIKLLSVDLKTWRAPKIDLLRMALSRVAPDPYVSRARLLDILGLNDAVFSECTEALKILPSSAEAQYYLGKVFFKQAKYTQALEHLRQAYSYGNKKKEVKVLLARTFLKLGEKERAKALAQDMLKEDPKSKEAKQFIENITKNSELENNELKP